MLLVVKIGAGDVDQLGGLFLDGSDDLRMAMPRRNNRNAGGKVQELVSVDVFYSDAAAAFGDHGIGAGVARET